VNLDLLLWTACCLAETAVIGLLLYRRLWRMFPVFFLYVVEALTGDVGLAIVFRSYHSSYRTWYLAGTIADSVLLFGVLVELAWSILRPIRASLSYRALIPVIGLILAVGAAIWPFAALPGVSDVSRETHLILHLQQTVSILQIIFFLALIGSSQILSIGWRDRELQIATGLGVYSFVSIGVAIFQLHQGSYVQYRHLFRIEVCGYICCLLYWIVSFVQQEAKRREFTPQMQNFLLAAAGAAHSSRVALNGPHTDRKRKPGKP